MLWFLLYLYCWDIHLSKNDEDFRKEEEQCATSITLYIHVHVHAIVHVLVQAWLVYMCWYRHDFFFFFFFFFLLENTYSTRIVWKKKQTWQATVNELRPLYRLWLCRWGIHDSADLRSRHQHQAHASSDIGETGQRTTGWGDLPRVPYTPCPSPDSNPHAYAYESKLRTMRPPRAPWLVYMIVHVRVQCHVHVSWTDELSLDSTWVAMVQYSLHY